MSYPILYSATETNFDHNGIGILSACVSCEVTEEANGIFELAMTYPMDGVHYSQISDRCLIKAKPNNEAEPQLFRVYSIKKTMSGVAIVYAKHISYDLSGIPVSVFTADNAPSAMMGLAQNAVVDCPFVFMTDKTTVANFSVRYPGSIRSKLGGSSGSILDVYGGEYEFDNYNVILHHQRGRNRGVSIRYGKNLTDIQQDRNCGSVATGVYPYWFDSDSGKVIELPEKIVNVDGTYGFSKIKMLALSDDFTSKPTEEEIRSYTESYIKNNNIGIPNVSLSVSFNQLEQSEEYKGLALLERVSLFDTVNVEFPALGVSATAKAVKIIYNVIMDRVESVTLGSVKSNIADTLANQQQQIEQAPSKNYVQSVANAASAVSTAWLTNGKGYKVERRDANGNTVDTLYMDTPDIDAAVNVLRIGQSGIGFSNKGVNGPYYSAWTLDGRFNADFIQAGSIKSNDGESVVIDLDNGRATLSGSLTATSGKTKAVLSAGNLAMYYNSVLYGFLSSINWGRDADDPKGVTLSMTDDAQFFSIGYGAEDSGYHGKYVINMGLNPDGNTERHQFYEDARFHNGIKGTSAEFSGKLAADWISCDEIAMTDSKGVEAYYVRLRDDELRLGDVNHKTYLFGSEVEVRNLIDPTLEHHAVPKKYVDTNFAPLINIGTYEGDINSLEIPINSVAWITPNTKNSPISGGYGVMETWGSSSSVRLQRVTQFASSKTVKTRFYGNSKWNDWATLSLYDGVTAQGTSGIWTYRKWDSGIAECWCERAYSVTTKASSAVTLELGDALPFAFTQNPIVHMSPTEETAYQHWFGAVHANTSQLAYAVVYAFAAKAVTGTAMVSVVGRWK